MAQRFSVPERSWIGETELIECIWERWMGAAAMRLARAALLQDLGKREGEKLGGAVPVTTIPRDQLPLLGTLADEGLVRVSGMAGVLWGW